MMDTDTTLFVNEPFGTICREADDIKRSRAVVSSHRLLHKGDQRGGLHIPLGDSKMGMVVTTDQRTNFIYADFASFSLENGLSIRTKGNNIRLKAVSDRNFD